MESFSKIKCTHEGMSCKSKNVDVEVNSRRKLCDVTEDREVKNENEIRLN